MNCFKNSLLFFAFFSVSFSAFSQGAGSPKMQDIFLTFLQKKMALTPQESSQMRPLVARYLFETRKIHRDFDDPLVREQQKIALKIKYRNLFTPIIGNDRSNRFFIEEQIFKRRVREELRQRKNFKS